jgi:hypothetical protein
MKREASIQALLKKAKADFAELKPAYEASLHEKHVREDLKVLVKNIFENLRSCLDYWRRTFSKRIAPTPRSQIPFTFRFAQHPRNSGRQ